MNELQHIDELLKQVSQEPANASVGDAEWAIVENKLKHRRNRVYALWFFLALISCSSVLFVTNNLLKSTDVPVVNQSINDIPTTIKSDPTVSLETQTAEITEASLNPVIPVTSQTDEIKDDLNTLTPIDQKIDIKDPSILKAVIAPNHKVVSINTKPSSEFLLDLKHPLNSLTYLTKEKNTNNLKNKTKAGHFEIGYTFTPSISGKYIHENASLSGLINKHYHEDVASSEKSTFSVNSGINILYHLPKSFFIASGLYISQRKEAINYNYIIKDVPLGTNSKINAYAPKEVRDYDTIQLNQSNSYHFVEIPFNIGYKQSISRNFEMRAQLGISYMKLLSREGSRADSYDLSLKDLADIKLTNSNIAANIKTGLYLTKNKFVIGVEPSYSININTLNDKATSSVYSNPFSFGLNISTNYKIYK